MKAIEQARRAIQQISLPEAEKPHRDPIDPAQLKTGQQVYINSLDGLGTVEEIHGRKVTVSVRGMTVRVKIQDISAPYLSELKKEQQEEKSIGNGPPGAHPDWSGCDGTQHHRQDRARSDS